MIDSIAYFLRFALVDLYIICIAVYSAIIYRSLGPELKSLAHVLFLSGLAEVLILIFIFNGYSNIPGLHIYTILNAILVSIFYEKIFNGFIKSKILYIVAIIFCLFSILNTIFVQKINEYCSNSLVLSGFIFTVYSLFSFIVLFNDIVGKGRHSLLRSLTWANSGFFIFYFIGMLIFHFGRYWNDQFSNLTSLFASAFSWVNFLSYTCMLIALWLRPLRV